MLKKVNSKFVVFFFIAVVLFQLNFCRSAYAQLDDPFTCQVVFSHMELDQDTKNLDEDSYDLIFVGADIQVPFDKKELEYGYETGANLTFDNEKNAWNASSGIGGDTVKVRFENKMFIFEYFAGGYIAYNFNDRFRIYGAAGPLLMYARKEFDPDKNNDEPWESETDSSLSAGLYGKIGFEAYINDQFAIGGGVRALKTDIEFDKSVGDVSMEGAQFFISLTFKI